MFLRTGKLLAVALVAVLGAAVPVPARGDDDVATLAEFNRRICGQVIDFTKNHGADRRIWSAILCQKRDVYVYLPPNYQPDGCYPLVVWCHGAFGDEHSFFDTAQIDDLDRLICCGCCPPMIVVCADGTCSGENKLLGAHSFYTNGCCGRFEDHIMLEVIPLVESCYSVCPDRRAHAIIGVSAGAYGGMGMAIKYRDYFGFGISHAGAINFRYASSTGDYFANFDPATYRWRTEYDPREVVGRYAHGLIRIRARMHIEPVFGSNPGVVQRVARNNPAELLISTQLQPGELEMLVTYPEDDNLNFDAHAESFAWIARCCRGAQLTLVRYPDHGHNMEFFRVSQRYAWRWLCPRIGRQSTDHSPALPTDTSPEPEEDTPLLPLIGD